MDNQEDEPPEETHDDDSDEERERWQHSSGNKRRGRRISIAHAVDLIIAGPEIARKLNQLDCLMRRLPAVKSKFELLLGLLDELGFDPVQFVYANKRLSALADGLAELEPDLNAAALYDDTLDFTIAGSPLRSLRRMLRAHARNLPRKVPICLVSLADGQLRISIRTWAVSIPAKFSTPGNCIVRRSFVDILLDALKTDEVIHCHVEPHLYRVNGFTHQD
ncbi:MAG: hypothetical protein N2111_03905 [Candidatus Sumerlaeaceae bacterium]|nr:hypothetical protein [Candidatus Sumerlaeaceae bacterium]